MKMQIKPNHEKRLKKAHIEAEKPSRSFEEIEDILKKALCEITKITKSVKGILLQVSLDEKIDYDAISKEYGTNRSGDIIFIQFAEAENSDKVHVAVVGAGHDVGEDYSEFSGKLLESMGWRWYKERAYIIPLKDLGGGPGGGKGDEDNYLKCRDGVEHYIGEYLINKEVPVLNYYQHRNVKKEAWDQMKSREFRIK